MKTYSEQRPWGKFIQFTHNEPSTVKIIIVELGQSLSLQFHRKRSEFWRVISGNPTITIGDITTHANTGDEFTIPLETKHQISAEQNQVHILEISTGDFDEADIIRLSDRYGRS